MPVTDVFRRLPIDSIVIPEGRQRKSIEVDDILDSVRKWGVLQPIIIEDETNILIAGERRLTASKKLNLPDIPVRYVSELSDTDKAIIEYEENKRRSDLPWLDEVMAVHGIHMRLSKENPDWSKNKTAARIGGLSTTGIAGQIRVAEAILAGNMKLIEFDTWRGALNHISRGDERGLADAIADFIHETETQKPVLTGQDGLLGHRPAVTSVGIGPQGAGTGGVPASVEPPPAPITKEERFPDSIFQADFHEWAKTYSGERFNFLHCDFPYGVNLQDSAQAKGPGWGTYEDTPETYWALLWTLARNYKRLLSPSCHIMFWFSMDFYTETLEFFRKELPEFQMQTFPLYWFKSDGRGIVPDPKRQPRRIVETALIGSLGDRQIVKPVGNGYAAPTSKIIHKSEKPRPVLAHFFQLFVDANTRLLDPTCGSGNALHAAEQLGATKVLGLEYDPNNVLEANRELRKSRILRAASKSVAAAV